MGKLGLSDLNFENLNSTQAFGRIICLALMIFLNISMFTLFARGLTKCRNSVEASLINTSTNLLLTGILGSVIFQEELDLFWWLGSAFISVGAYFVLSDQMNNVKQD